MDRSSVQKARAKLKKQQQDSEDTKKKNVEKKIKLLEKCIKSWNNNIIPNWHKMFNSVETKRLCSIGIPNHLRGEVWPLLIGNDFHLDNIIFERLCNEATLFISARDKETEAVEKKQENLEDEVCSPSPECSPDVADDDSTHSFKCTRFEGYEAIVKERLTRTVASSSSRALVVGSKDDSCLPRAATNSSWKRTKSSGSLESQLHLNRIVVATDHPFLNDVPRQITLSCDTSLPPPPPLYNAISSRTKRTTKSVNSSTGDTSISDSMGYIDQDVPRTFADLGVFQKDGPMEASLLHVLRCYVCFRPHVGYTQGMSYIAGVLLLNMDEKTAFRCFANLLNRPGLEDLFRLKKEAFDMFVHTFDYFFERLLPYLHYHLKREKVQSEMFLMDWILSLFAKALSLEATARLWDKFLFEGEVGIVRGALGLLRYLAPQLAVLSIEGIVKLLINTKNVDPDELMHHVQIISQVLPIEKFEKIRERFYYSKVSPRQNSIRILTESLRSMQSRAYNAFNSFTSPYPHSPPNNSPSYYKTDSPGSPGAQQVTNDVPISLRLSPKSSVGTAANGSVLSSTVQKEYRLSPSKMEGESSQKLNSANNCLIS